MSWECFLYRYVLRLNNPRQIGNTDSDFVIQNVHASSTRRLDQDARHTAHVNIPKSRLEPKAHLLRLQRRQQDHDRVLAELQLHLP